MASPSAKITDDGASVVSRNNAFAKIFIKPKRGQQPVQLVSFDSRNANLNKKSVTEENSLLGGLEPNNKTTQKQKTMKSALDLCKTIDKKKTGLISRQNFDKIQKMCGIEVFASATSKDQHIIDLIEKHTIV